MERIQSGDPEAHDWVPCVNCCDEQLACGDREASCRTCAKAHNKQHSAARSNSRRYDCGCISPRDCAACLPSLSLRGAACTAMLGAVATTPALPAAAEVGDTPACGQHRLQWWPSSLLMRLCSQTLPAGGSQRTQPVLLHGLSRSAMRAGGHSRGRTPAVLCCRD